MRKLGLQSLQALKLFPENCPLNYSKNIFSTEMDKYFANKLELLSKDWSVLSVYGHETGITLQRISFCFKTRSSWKVTIEMKFYQLGRFPMTLWSATSWRVPQTKSERTWPWIKIILTSKVTYFRSDHAAWNDRQQNFQLTLNIYKPV